MAPVAKTPVVKKATFQDNVKAALKGGKASAQAVLKFVAAERNVPVEKMTDVVYEGHHHAARKNKKKK